MMVMVKEMMNNTKEKRLSELQRRMVMCSNGDLMVVMFSYGE